jgi:glycosyltransferase involved in cell wall biosynthesis
VEVIPNYSFMNVTGISDGSSKRAIAVGRLDWQKGFDRLIEVWQLVNRRHPDWHLDIYGSGVLESELRKAIADAQPCNADIHPFTPDISARYAESTVYLMTSRFEGFGLVLLEAMKHGLPCVAFDCRYGPADIIADGRSGYVVADDDIKGFADKVCSIIENPQLWKQMSAEGIKRAEAYNLDAIMNQWTALFTTLRP